MILIIPKTRETVQPKKLFIFSRLPTRSCKVVSGEAKMMMWEGLLAKKNSEPGIYYLVAENVWTFAMVTKSSFENIWIYISWNICWTIAPLRNLCYCFLLVDVVGILNHNHKNTRDYLCHYFCVPVSNKFWLPIQLGPDMYNEPPNPSSNGVWAGPKEGDTCRSALLPLSLILSFM